MLIKIKSEGKEIVIDDRHILLKKTFEHGSYHYSVHNVYDGSLLLWINELIYDNLIKGVSNG